MLFGFPSLRAHLIAALLGVAASLAVPAPAEADTLGPGSRCLALVGYAEAVSEGNEGMAAVMRVVHNRIRDGRFPGNACAVVRQGGQFQAIEESRRIKTALKAPHRMSLEKTLNTRTSFTKMMLGQARRLAVDPQVARGKDPTSGALYFVNPHMMDPSRCPWFAKLKRTTEIGGHVFMTHYGDGEERAGPALDCATAGRDFGKGGYRLPKTYATGPFDPRGPRLATRTATPAMIKAWKRTGQYEKRVAQLKKRFKPGWYGEDEG